MPLFADFKIRNSARKFVVVVGQIAEMNQICKNIVLAHKIGHRVEIHFNIYLHFFARKHFYYIFFRAFVVVFQTVGDDHIRGSLAPKVAKLFGLHTHNYGFGIVNFKSVLGIAVVFFFALCKVHLVFCA